MRIDRSRAHLRISGVIVALILVTSCSGDGDPRGRVTAAGRPASGSSIPSSPLSPARQVRTARMVSGTDSTAGTLAVWCERDDCTRTPGAAPKRYVKAVGSGLLLFVVGAEPSAARVVIRGAGKDVAAQGPLRPGTSMAFRADLEPGRYVVTLVAQFPDREARWVFGVVRAARTS